ncbi:MAG: outer membrane beta-barrel protein [Gemmatimonas sp.]
MRLSVRFVAISATSLILASTVSAQAGVGASLTPYAGYLITGDWYDGPIGTSLATSNSPMLGVQGSVPLTRGIALVGNLAYASGDLRVGLPVLGGVNIGTAKTWLYDAGVELGGLAGKGTGVAPFVQGGVGGMTSDIKNSLFDVRASNFVYTAGVGVDVGLAKGFAVRVQAKDWIGKFNSEDAIGFRVNGNLTHNWALSAGVRLGF